ncbi:MAG TPA: DUF1328 domain-containing protein [Burkholderiales bacterium]|nr:DUF1328 domain-containing protein [Burkholderiales bacterium]
MLTWAVSFLLVAIFSGIFGFVAAGPAGLLFFCIFFALFIWALVEHRRRGR